MDQIKKAYPHHALLDAERLTSLISAAIHSKLYLNDIALADHLWRQAKELHSENSYLLGLKRKIERYRKPNSITSTSVTKDENRLEQYPESLKQWFEALNTNDSLAFDDIDRVLVLLNEDDSDFSAAVKWAFSRYLEQNTGETSDLTQEEKQRYLAWLNTLKRG